MNRNNQGWNPWSASGGMNFQGQGANRQGQGQQQQQFQQQQGNYQGFGQQNQLNQQQMQAQQLAQSTNMGRGFQQGMNQHNQMMNMNMMGYNQGYQAGGQLGVGIGANTAPTVQSFNNAANPLLAANQQMANNPYASNMYAQQQLQQQMNHTQTQQHNIFQANAGYQPPLPPGPPPKDQPTRAMQMNQMHALFNNSNNAINPVPPPLPNTAAPEVKPVPPPPPPVADKEEAQIPEQILNLLRNADTARQFQQAAEVLSQISPLMALNVSQELFGGKKSTGIPGLDGTFVKSPLPSKSNDETAPAPPPSLPQEQNPQGQAALLPHAGKEDGLKPQQTSQQWNEPRIVDDKTEIKETEIEWELRPGVKQEVEKVDATSSNGRKSIFPSSNMSSTLADDIVRNPKFQAAKQITSIFDGDKDNKESAADKQKLDVSDPSINDDESMDGSENDPSSNNTFSATIPLPGSSDGQPVQYNRKTLKAFDKKFRDWEKQFDNWKISNQNHPDKNAYDKYMDQWNLWRQQLIEQRRFIIDSMNKARLEGNDIALQKSLANVLDENKSESHDRPLHPTPKNESTGPTTPHSQINENNRTTEAPRNAPHPPNMSGSNMMPIRNQDDYKNQNTQNWRNDMKGNTPVGGRTDRNPFQMGSQENPWNTGGGGGGNSSNPPSLMSMKVLKPTELLAPNNNTPNAFSQPGGGGSNVQRFQGGPSSREVDPPQKPLFPSATSGGQQQQQQAVFSTNQSSWDNNTRKQPAKSVNKKFGSVNLKEMEMFCPGPEDTSDGSRKDRPVERILRDRDRQGLLPEPAVQDVPEPQRKPPVNADRVARDPPAKANAPFSMEPVSWEMPNNNRINNDATVNPFETPQNQQNPFAQQGQYNNSASAGWKDDNSGNLPTLSDFLKKDEFVGVSSNNRQGFGNSRDSNFSNERFSQQQSQNPSASLSFEVTSKALPLIVAAKPKPKSPTPTPLENEDNSSSNKNDITEWFTRDRRATTFEDECTSRYDEPSMDNDQYDPPVAVIDYGHGSSAPNNEDDEYDLPRGERPVENYDQDQQFLNDDLDEAKDVVTFDYGHGSVPPARNMPMPYQPAGMMDGGYRGGPPHYNQDPYRGEPVERHDEDFYSQSRFQAQRGRGLGFRGARGGYSGNFPHPGPGPMPIPFPQMSPHQQAMGFPPGRGRGRGRGRGFPLESSVEPREISIPHANPGKGRGMPSKFGLMPGQDDDFVGRSLDTERVSSPEIIILDSPSREGGGHSSRRAPPRDTRSDRVLRDSSRERSNSKSDRRDWSRDRSTEGSGRRGNVDDLDQPLLSYEWEEQEENPERQGRENKTGRGSPPPRSQRPRDYSPSQRRDRERVLRDRTPPRRERAFGSPARRDRERDRSPPRRDRDRDRNSPPRRDRDRDPPRRDREREYRVDRDRFSNNDERSRRTSRSPPGRGRLAPSDSLHGGKDLGLSGSSNPPPPRYQTVLIEDILNQPGRLKRPSQIVVVLRGLPGAGKSYVAKLMKDREIEMGGSAPRILSLDDYFMQETEKLVKDPLTKSEVKETVMVYEYEEDHEPKYRRDLVKTFRKNVENGYFPFIIVDCVNDQVKHFEEIVSFATQRKFQVYIADVEESVETCVKRNIHNRTKDQIMRLHRNWQHVPPNFVKLDVKTLLQDEAVQDVEMEDVSDTEPEVVAEVVAKDEKSDQKTAAKWEEEEEESMIPEKSKWETMQSEEKLNKLDGLAKKRTAKDDDDNDKMDSNLSSWLESHLPEDYVSRQVTKPGQKRVRWADIEEKQAQSRMREVGFVVGQDWNRMLDPSGGAGALTRIKYF